MKLNNKNVIVILYSALFLTACNEKMNYIEYNIYDQDYVSQSFTYVGALMTDIYNHVDYDFGQHYSGAILGSATDESVFATSGNTIEDFYNGAWSPSNALAWMWSSMYEGIADCNLVLEQFQGLTFSSDELNDDYEQQMYRYENYKYEARLFRAYFYFNLVRQFGGVPIVTHSVVGHEANSISQMERSSSDEVFQYIFDECNAIKDSIIEDYSNLGNYALSTLETGRANNLVVLALRARAALYWASPLFNTDNDASRYHTAATYTKDLLDACEDRGMKLAADYSSLWAADNYSNEDITCEIIFGRRVYGSSTSGTSATFETYNYPIGIESGAGGNCPTQNLVDAYEMQATGLGIDETGSGYDENDPYTGRDPRFEATVAKNGDVWPTAYKTALETYYGGTNGEPLANATPTGYYIKKYCHGAIDLSSSSSYAADNHEWITFRLGEFYLNMAEILDKYLGSYTATNSEFGNSALYYINKVRERSDMPDFPEDLSESEFWTKYTNERFVELAFEGHRFFDVRRWKEASTYFQSITEMKLTKASDGTITYTRNKVSRQWNDKMYLFPIPETEIIKNSNLTQNSGW